MHLLLTCHKDLKIMNTDLRTVTLISFLLTSDGHDIKNSQFGRREPPSWISLLVLPNKVTHNQLISTFKKVSKFSLHIHLIYHLQGLNTVVAHWYFVQGYSSHYCYHWQSLWLAAWISDTFPVIPLTNGSSTWLPNTITFLLLIPKLIILFLSLNQFAV